MNDAVEFAQTLARRTPGGRSVEAMSHALIVLADEVDRLAAQLERTRTELAQATVRLAEWDRMNTVLAAVLPALREQMEPTPSREAGL